MLNSKTKARFKKLLEEKREELAEGFNSVRARGVRGSGEGDKDYIDYAVSSYTKEFLLSLSDMEREQLMRVEDALKTVDSDEYGQCQECEEPIDQKRLEAIPWAMYCLKCQELADRGLLNAPAGDERDQGDDE